MVIADDGAPSVKTLGRADAHETRGRLALAVPVAELVNELLELHRTARTIGRAVEGEGARVGDALRVGLAHPRLSAPRIPRHPIRIVLRHGVAEVQRERHPIRVDHVGVEREHLAHVGDREGVLRFEVEVQHADAAPTAARFETRDVHHHTAVFAARPREVHARELIEDIRDARLRGFEHAHAEALAPLAAHSVTVAISVMVRALMAESISSRVMRTTRPRSLRQK